MPARQRAAALRIDEFQRVGYRQAHGDCDEKIVMTFRNRSMGASFFLRAGAGSGGNSIAMLKSVSPWLGSRSY
jgi:hypothetical protein